MKWLLVAGAVVAVLVVGLLVVGWLLPEKHTASQHVQLAAPPEAVWALLTNVEAFPTWRSDVKAVERLPDRDGRPVWVEEGSNGRITFATERREPPRLLVTRIADPDLPFGGTWTYEVAQTPGGSTVTITEDGAIYNPVFRVMARFVFGYEATMKAFLQSLDAAVREKR
jgi:uncharacterized protein YndB with AHSA1/START domain